MIYNFVCLDCEKVFEIHSSPFSIQKENVNCPDCNKNNIRRKYNANPIHYKGRGFTKKVKGDEEKSAWS